MAYSTSSPPYLISSALSGTAQVWGYNTTDTYSSTTRIVGYISNAKDLGMLKGDRIYVTNTAATPPTIQIAIVSAISAAGAADLSDGTAITATNSD